MLPRREQRPVRAQRGDRARSSARSSCSGRDVRRRNRRRVREGPALRVARGLGVAEVDALPKGSRRKHLPWPCRAPLCTGELLRADAGEGGKQARRFLELLRIEGQVAAAPAAATAAPPTPPPSTERGEARQPRRPPPHRVPEEVPLARLRRVGGLREGEEHPPLLCPEGVAERREGRGGCRRKRRKPPAERRGEGVEGQQPLSDGKGAGRCGDPRQQHAQRGARSSRGGSSWRRRRRCSRRARCSSGSTRCSDTRNTRTSSRSTRCSSSSSSTRRVRGGVHHSDAAREALCKLLPRGIPEQGQDPEVSRNAVRQQRDSEDRARGRCEGTLPRLHLGRGAPPHRHSGEVEGGRGGGHVGRRRCRWRRGLYTRCCSSGGCGSSPCGLALVDALPLGVARLAPLRERLEAPLNQTRCRFHGERQGADGRDGDARDAARSVGEADGRGRSTCRDGHGAQQHSCCRLVPRLGERIVIPCGDGSDGGVGGSASSSAHACGAADVCRAAPQRQRWRRYVWGRERARVLAAVPRQAGSLCEAGSGSGDALGRDGREDGDRDRLRVRARGENTHVREGAQRRRSGA